MRPNNNINRIEGVISASDAANLPPPKYKGYINPRRIHPDIVSLCICELRPIDPAKIPLLPRHCRHRWKHVSVLRMIVKVHTSAINNKQNLARTVSGLCGYGEWIVMMHKPGVKNKYFNSKFTCLFQRGLPCKFKENGSCRVYSVHQKGWACKANPKTRSLWQKRAHLIVKPKNPTMWDEDGLADDFSVEWKLCDMHPLWFWNARNREDVHEMFDDTE